MAGTGIEAVRHGVELFERETKGDQFARQTVHVGVIIFADDAQLLDGGLVPIDEFHAPALAAAGVTSLGKALTLLNQSLDRDVRTPGQGSQKGDWKPLVFILTDGFPTDDWQTQRGAVLDRQERKTINVITVGCGTVLDRDRLKAIAIGPSFVLDESRDKEGAFIQFFRWMTQTVTNMARAASLPGAKDDAAVNLPKPPSVLQFNL